MSATGAKHVYRSSLTYGKPFYVTIKVWNKTYCVGYFATIHEAAAAARGFNKALKIFGPSCQFIDKIAQRIMEQR